METCTALPGGWSEADIINLLTPPKQPRTNACLVAGWSPESLLNALSPSAPQVGMKRHSSWKTPPPQGSYTSPDNYKKIPNLNSTPIDLSSPSPSNKMNRNSLEDHEIEDLSQTLADHSLSNHHTLPPHSPKVPFRSARSCFEAEPCSDSLDEPLCNGWTLYDFQKAAIRQCLAQRRTILALDMGLGKTIISLLWAKLTHEAHLRNSADSASASSLITVAICPCTLLSNWEREATSLGFQCIKMNDKKPLHSSSNSKSRDGSSSSAPVLLLVSWAQIPSPDSVLGLIFAFFPSCATALASEPNESLQRNISSHVPSPTLSGRFLIIADEAHAMQSLSSQRTQAAIRLCLHPSCHGLVLATGTPMKNGRPANILPLLIALRHPLGRNRIHFERRYCAAKKTRFCPWDTSGAAYLEELKERIGNALIRRTKEECLPELPQLQRVRVKAELSMSLLRGYQEIVSKFKAQKSCQGRGQGQGRGGQGQGSGLEMMTQLRQYTSAAKVPFTASLVLRLLEEKPDSPIVIFVWFRDTAISLIHRLRDTDTTTTAGREIRSAYITGDIVKQTERQEVVDLFQAGQLDVLICSFGVGSTGLTLTRSSRLILLDRPWTPGDAKQAEDRIRRIGQRAAEVQSLWVAGFPLDDSLDRLLQKKDLNSLRVIEVSGVESKVGTGSWFSNHESSSSQSNPKGSLAPAPALASGGGRDIRDYLLQQSSKTSVAQRQHLVPVMSSPRAWWEGEGDGEGEEESSYGGSGDGRGKENRNRGVGEGEGAESIMTAVLREILM